jgi:YVTN family beta-propeller protein
VIATATSTVVKTITVGTGPVGVAITPDGTHAYVANETSNTISVIATATNTGVATVKVGSGPFAVAIMPPSKGISFSAFNAKLEIHLEKNPKQDSFDLQSGFALASDSGSIVPVTLGWHFHHDHSARFL